MVVEKSLSLTPWNGERVPSHKRVYARLRVRGLLPVSYLPLIRLGPSDLATLSP
jgi:hypothetical protein